VLKGDRVVLARAITLVESNAARDLEQAQQVLRNILPHCGHSLRIGITGVPGSGKSTFIEALGVRLIEAGHKVGVTAIDPTSTRTGGSILGDKTRMGTLAGDERAFIRPSPTSGQLGGVGRKTRETMLLLEAAGFDVILVETVGVGQSEVTVRSMVDFFLLLLVAGAGDELQGIKRGVVELADAIVVHKADGENVDRAQAARIDYERAIHYLTPVTEGWTPRVVTASSVSGDGIAELWKLAEQFRDETNRSGVFEKRRREQAREWVHAIVREALLNRFRSNDRVAEILQELESAVMHGRLPATTAAQRLLDAFLSDLR
jgi:LAO/AO transport system kinase